MKRVPLQPMVIFSNATTDKFFPATPWMDSVPAEMIRDGLETLNMPAGMTVTVGFQVANTPNSPDTAAALDSSRTSDGLTFPGAFADKSADTGDRQLVRFGYLAKGSDGTLRQCWAHGMVEIQKK